MLQKKTIDTLKAAYRVTWQAYAAKLNALEQLRHEGTPDRCTIESAVLELEKARVSHNSARDRLAQSLGGVFGADLAPEVESNERRISAAAHLLWELAGRPEGTADYDWNRARQLVRTASASV